MTKKNLLIAGTNLIEFDSSQNIPTVLYYSKEKEPLFGFRAIKETPEQHLLNRDFKVHLGNLDPTASLSRRQQFSTASGNTKSAAGLTADFLLGVSENILSWLHKKNIENIPRVLFAEPLSISKDIATPNWLSNYRRNILKILTGKFQEIDFLPEPFAVFQYYRYGVRHPLIIDKGKYFAFVIDYGGGTFDTCIIETTKEGDISETLKHSRPIAAQSNPVGGFHLNYVIAETLYAKYLSVRESSRIKQAINLYKRWVKGELLLMDLSNENQNFIMNFYNTVYSVEDKKISLCQSIIDWDLDTNRNVNIDIVLPKNPFSISQETITVVLTDEELKQIFIEKIWNPRLKPIIKETLGRSRLELKGEKLAVTLLSGGSANVGWLVRLLDRDFSGELGQILELKEDYQQVVAKGLAVECARRTYDPDNEFSSVTYNQVFLLLDPDTRCISRLRFKPLSDGLPDVSDTEGLLLPSASALRKYFGQRIRWRVRPGHPPRHNLDYYFLRALDDCMNDQDIFNIESHSILTPHSCKFDSSIKTEILIREDGTCTPSFVYREGKSEQEIIRVTGKPFYLDMTFNEKRPVAQAYIGFDFGTSNTSVSYVDRKMISVYEERARDKGWMKLSDLVNELPYPLSEPLARYLGASNLKELIECSREFVEAALALCCYVTFLEYCSYRSTQESRIFKGFSQRSAGPLWGLLINSLEKLEERGDISKPLKALLSTDIKQQISEGVKMLSEHKHHKVEENTIDHFKPVDILANLSIRVFKENVFGFFEGVQKKKFTNNYSGRFRHAIANPTFYKVSSYSGKEAFSEEQAFIVNAEAKTALPLYPLVFWEKCSGNHPNILHCYFYDMSLGEDKFSFKAVGYKCTKEILVSNPEYGQLARDLIEFRKSDRKISLLTNIDLSVVER